MDISLWNCGEMCCEVHKTVTQKSAERYVFLWDQIDKMWEKQLLKSGKKMCSLKVYFALNIVQYLVA